MDYVGVHMDSYLLGCAYGTDQCVLGFVGALSMESTKLCGPWSQSGSIYRVRLGCPCSYTIV